MHYSDKEKKIALWLALSEMVAWEKHYGLLSYLEVESNSSDLDTEIHQPWIALAKKRSLLYILYVFFADIYSGTFSLLPCFDILLF